MNNKKRRWSSVVRASIILLFISIVNYFLARSVFIVYAKYELIEKILAVLFFTAEIFVMLHAFGYFINVWRRAEETPLDFNFAPLGEFPAVAILIPARHEPKEVLERTILSCSRMDYPAKAIYLLDDSSQEKYQAEAEELCRQYGVQLFRRQERHGAKAGIINDCTKTLTHKYIVIFDADQNPISNFLKRLVPILQQDEKLAFVQTPQFYSNLEANRVSFAANMQQAVFYEYITEGKSSNEAMVSCGTNVIFRRAALEDVGGLDESSVTEDFATSIKLHLKGWKSLYYNHVNTFGMGPEDLGAYFKQQNRWAMGNVGVFKKIITEFLKFPLALKPRQWFEYAATGSYYLIGWAYLFLLLCPVFYVFFNIPSFFMQPAVYSLTFFPYLVLSIAVFYVSMGAKRYSIPEMFKGQLLSFVTIPVYARAALFGFLGVKGTFQVTPKSRSKSIAYLQLWPQLSFWAINLAALTWGMRRFQYEQSGALSVNVVWIVYHFLLLSSIFYFNQEGIPKKSCIMLPKGIKFEYQVIRETPQDREDRAWRNRLGIFLPQYLQAGSLVMLKLSLDDRGPIIFDAEVLWSAPKKNRRGFLTQIGVVTINEEDGDQLKKLCK